MHFVQSLFSLPTRRYEFSWHAWSERRMYALAYMSNVRARANVQIDMVRYGTG